MPKKHLLFLCSRNKLRSPTAEAIFANHPGVEADSAGLNPDAEVPLSEEQIEWADLILVMEKIHRTRLNRKFKSALADKVRGLIDDIDLTGKVRDAVDEVDIDDIATDAIRDEVTARIENMDISVDVSL